MISRASSLVSPPMTEGADTPGIHLLLITSTSKETKTTSACQLSRWRRRAKACPACVRYSEAGSILCLRMSRSIQTTSAPFDLRYSQWMLEQAAPLLPNSTKRLWESLKRGSSSISRKGEPECAFPSFSGRTSKWASRLMTAMGLPGQVERRAETLGQLWSLDPPTPTSSVSEPWLRITLCLASRCLCASSSCRSSSMSPASTTKTRSLQYSSAFASACRKILGPTDPPMRPPLRLVPSSQGKPLRTTLRWCP